MEPFFVRARRLGASSRSFSWSGWGIRLTASVAVGSLLLAAGSASAKPPAARAGARGSDSVSRVYGRCSVPLGARVFASNRYTVVYSASPFVPNFSGTIDVPVYGCVRSNGRNLLLTQENGTLDGAFYVASAVLDGGEIALLQGWGDEHYGGQWSYVSVYDPNSIPNYLVPYEGGERTVCTPFPAALYGLACPWGGIDDLLLGDGVSAVHIRYANGQEEIQVSDANGVYDVDSGTFPNTALTDLKLTGNDVSSTLTWKHQGTPRSVVLTPLTIS